MNPSQPRFAYGKLPAQDTERARRFYAGTLGLDPFAERDGHLYYDVGGARFMIYASAGVASGCHDQLGFLVDDLAWHVSQLRQRGVTFDGNAGPDGIADFGPVQAAWFNDSEGNLINLIHGTSPLWSYSVPGFRGGAGTGRSQSH
jgi:catechol-2,3-dioxygenase